ncbi:MAG: CvpA family protein [Bryobacteraceae bacterium]
MLPLNWLDISLLAIILWSAFSGLRAGLARVVVGLVATVVGLLAGFWCYRLVAAKLLPWVSTPTVANVLGFLLILSGTLVLGALIGSLLSRVFSWIGLSWFNHLLGGLAGILRGALIISALLDFFVAFSPSPTPAALEESQVLPYVSRLSGWMVDLAPRELKDAFTEQIQNLRQLWSKPPARKGTEV